MSKARDLADLAKNANDRLDTVATSDGALSSRNMVVNGDMKISQRGTSHTFSSGNSIYTTVDRFKNAYFGSWGSNHSEITQEADGPDGFQYSCKVKALSAQTYASALGSWVQHTFENQNLSALQNGSGLKDFTVSLWLKSNKTGNVTISVEGEYYSYSTYVTINSASTWEYKTVTFPATTLNVGVDYTGDPSGGDFNLKIGLGSNGSWLVDVDDQWNDKSTNRGVLSPQQTNFQANVNDYLQFTGVQLEVGSQSTDFEHIPYSDQLARCHRYFQRFGNLTGNITNGICNLNIRSANDKYGVIHHPVVPRAQPTVGYSNLSHFILYAGSTSTTPTDFQFQGTTASGSTEIYVGTGSFGAAGWGGWLRLNSSTGYLDFDMEL